jgi:hypothetical protein
MATVRLMGQGPRELPATALALSALTPSRRSSRYRRRPFCHCFQTALRSLDPDKMNQLLDELEAKEFARQHSG